MPGAAGAMWATRSWARARSLDLMWTDFAWARPAERFSGLWRAVFFQMRGIGL